MSMSSTCWPEVGLVDPPGAAPAELAPPEPGVVVDVVDAEPPDEPVELPEPALELLEPPEPPLEPAVEAEEPELPPDDPDDVLTSGVKGFLVVKISALGATCVVLVVVLTADDAPLGMVVVAAVAGATAGGALLPLKARVFTTSATTMTPTKTPRMMRARRLRSIWPHDDCVVVVVVVGMLTPAAPDVVPEPLTATG